MIADVLDAARWRERAAAHAARADALAPGGPSDAVTSFLFTYYSMRPGALRRWHPGAGTGLAGGAEHAAYRWYATRGGITSLDLPSFLADRGAAVRFYDRLLAAVAARPARHDCFGLHEWAMVYRDGPAGRSARHPLPLRLGGAGTDEVVASLPLRCSHYDAFRFFTAEARPLNRDRLDREGQVDTDQPGCVHVTMDLYKAAYKLGPLVPGELLLDCFELATRARVVDMRASPYDLTGLGHSPIRIETADGRAEYAAAQRDLTAAAAPLRARLAAVTGAALAAVTPC